MCSLEDYEVWSLQHCTPGFEGLEVTRTCFSFASNFDAPRFLYKFFQGVSRVLGLGSIGNVKGKSRLLGIALLSSDSVTMSKTFIGGDVCRRVRKLRRQKKC